MPAPDPVAEAKGWLAYAEDDLRLATAILRLANVQPGQACYHAQQAGEKAIKATLVLAGVPMPRTHDLVLLGQVTPAGWHVHQLPAVDLADLARWAVDARYPDAPGGALASAVEAQVAVTFAERIVDDARQDLADHS